MNRAIAKLRLGDITRFVSGGTPSKQVPRYWGGSTPWVSAKDMKSLHIDSSIDTLSDSGRDAASLVPRGTLLILVRGMTLFKSIPIGIASRELAINQDLKGLITNGAVSPEFLAYSLLAKESELLQMVEAAGHGTGRLDTDALKDVLVRVPSLPEQHQVASAIATWDTAIQKTEQLIAAKERRREALTQRLYMFSDSRGKLSRFSDLLSESMESGSSGRHARKITVKLYGKGVLAKEEKRHGSEQTQYFVRRAGQLIYSKLDFLNGAFGIIPPELEGYESTLDLPAFDIAPTVNPVWLLDYLTRPKYYTRQVGLARGQRKARRVHPSDLLASSLHVPPRDLQDRIAEILNSSQCDIDKSNRLLESLKTQKRGLMQKLLTGQWRLPTQDIAEEATNA